MGINWLQIKSRVVVKHNTNKDAVVAACFFFVLFFSISDGFKAKKKPAIKKLMTKLSGIKNNKLSLMCYSQLFWGATSKKERLNTTFYIHS